MGVFHTVEKTFKEQICLYHFLKKKMKDLYLYVYTVHVYSPNDNDLTIEIKKNIRRQMCLHIQKSLNGQQFQNYSINIRK